MTSSNVAETTKLENGQDCKVRKEDGCAELVDMRCPDREEMVAYDRSGCNWQLEFVFPHRTLHRRNTTSVSLEYIMHHGPNFRTHADYTQRPATPAISFKEESAVHALPCAFLDDPTHESALTHESATASLSGGSPNDCDGLDDLGQAGVGFDTSTILPGDLASDIVQGSLGDHTNDHYSQHPADEDAMYGGFTDERIWGSPPPDETQFASTAIGAGLMQFDGIPLANSQVLHQHDFETPERAAPLPTFEASSNGANSAHEIGIRFSTEPHDGCAQSSNLNDAAFTIDQRPEFQSAYFGLSGESDPYLLRHYLYNDADEFPFLRDIPDQMKTVTSYGTQQWAYGV
ncbi:fungal specific transcription factor domain-containing protein [Colletotrichum filicis]|nr:fungal specific transcription factor domain-containing protein [Colletotrichum filicis]